MSASGEVQEFHDFVWTNHAPAHSRFFARLLVQGRIQCRSNLLVKHIVGDASCELCHDDTETPDHLILACSFAQQFWGTIRIAVPASATTRWLWELPRPDHIPLRHYSTFLILCSWQLWKHRNEVVFRGADLSLPVLLINCRETVRLWRCQKPNSDASVVDSWCSSLSIM